MTEVAEASTSSPSELLGLGRRHLAVRDFHAAVESLANACELLAKEHGDTADQCAEAYLWYGKSLLGLSREESGVLGDGMPGAGAEEEDDDNEEQEDGENGEAEANGEVEPVSSGVADKGEADKSEPSEKSEKKEVVVEKAEAESTSMDVEAGSSKEAAESEEPGPSSGDPMDESTVNLDNEDDVDNLQLAWEMLDLSRSILFKRVQGGGGDAARALLADVHLALGEVALESETYDKAVLDMQSCLELQKELYRSDDRRIAETHYQIGLANSLASNFEEAITHFKNAANILETRIKSLESPTAASDDATVKKYTSADPQYTIEAEIKELKELLPEIREKISDMMDYKAETIKRVREALCPTNGEGAYQNDSKPNAFQSGSSSGPSAFQSGSSSGPSAFQNGSGSSAFQNGSASGSSSRPAADISHLVRRKRKSSDGEASPAKRPNS